MSDDLGAQVRVAEVTPEDWRLWRELRRQALTESPDAFGSTVALEASYDEEAWRARMDRGRMVVAWLDDVPVGMGGTIEDGPGVRRVVSMWVTPGVRGRGVGARILDEVVTAALAAGVRLRLDVAEGNPARRTYERAGFVDTGRREPIRPGASSMKVSMELP